MFGYIGHNQSRPAKDMGLVKDSDFIGQRLEAYHVCRVASAGVRSKMLNGLGLDFLPPLRGIMENIF